MVDYTWSSNTALNESVHKSKFSREDIASAC